MVERKLVYDLPTRVFHWVFAALFLTAFAIAKTTDDESAAFAWHMLARLTLLPLVLLRLLWGIVGTRHARFSDFVLAPSQLLGYLRGIFSGAKARWAGHNPASSWAALTMLGLVLAQIATGWLMTSGGNAEAFEELHELLANALIILAVLHVAGVVLHTLRHREMIALSMVDGRKADVPDGETIGSQRGAFGLLFVALVAGFALQLWNNFDPDRGVVQMFGTTLQLGEGGERLSAGGGDGHDEDADEGHDD